MSYIARIPTFAAPSSRPVVRISPSGFAAIAGAADGAALIVCGIAASAYFKASLADEAIPLDGVATGAAVAAAFLLAARARGLYELSTLSRPIDVVRSLLVALLTSVLAFACARFLFGTGTARAAGATASFAVLATAALATSRMTLGAVARQGICAGAISRRRAVVVGLAGELDELNSRDLENFGLEEVERVALVGAGLDDRPSEHESERVARAIDMARREGATEFALLFPWSRDRLILEVGRLLETSPLPARLYPDHNVRALIKHKGAREPGRFASLTVQRGALSNLERLAKRGFDLVVAVLALAVSSPVLATAALAVRLDSPGPIIFRQRRRGFDGREFTIFKFRTMRALETDGAVIQARRGDDRVTRVGRVLRRSSLDELPQLFNIARGDMSLVGPRPHAVSHDDRYQALIDGYALRRRARPGLTGAAQVLGFRGETSRLIDMERRVERDIWYIRNWSFALDLKILFQTCFALLRHEAY